MVKLNWREYLIEAWGLGTFMIIAGGCATFLYYPQSPLVTIIPGELGRGILMGMAMGLSAIAIIYSPWGKGKYLLFCSSFGDVIGEKINNFFIKIIII